MLASDGPGARVSRRRDSRILRQRGDRTRDRCRPPNSERDHRRASRRGSARTVSRNEARRREAVGVSARGGATASFDRGDIDGNRGCFRDQPFVNLVPALPAERRVGRRSWPRTRRDIERARGRAAPPVSARRRRLSSSPHVDDARDAGPLQEMNDRDAPALALEDGRRIVGERVPTVEEKSVLEHSHLGGVARRRRATAIGCVGPPPSRDSPLSTTRSRPSAPSAQTEDRGRASACGYDERAGAFAWVVTSWHLDLTVTESHRPRPSASRTASGSLRVDRLSPLSLMTDARAVSRARSSPAWRVDRRGGRRARRRELLGCTRTLSADPRFTRAPSA